MPAKWPKTPRNSSDTASREHNRASRRIYQQHTERLVSHMRRSWRVLALLAFILVLAAACTAGAPAGSQQFSNIGNNLT